MKAKPIKKNLFLITFSVLLAAGVAGAGQKPPQIASPFDTAQYAPLKASLALKSVGTVFAPIALKQMSMDSALIDGADYLQYAQADITEDNAGNGNPDSDPEDGGWDWVLSSSAFTHSGSASPQNIYGATAMGLYYAYLETSSASYMTAMTDAANIMSANAGIRSASDLIFLMNFQDLPGVTPNIYQDAAKAKFDARITYYGTAAALAAYIREARAAQGYEDGIIPWDIGAWAVAAQMLADRFPSDPYDFAQAADDIAEVIYQDSYLQNPGYFDLTTSKNSGWDPNYENSDYYMFTLGITGVIDAFVSADVHTDKIASLVATLIECQYGGEGAFSYCYGANEDDEDWQTTAYAVRSLARANQSFYQTNISRACYWLGTQQDASGGWRYSDGSHYPEVGGECTAALYFGESLYDDKPGEVWVDDDYSPANSGGHLWGYDAFVTIQEGINGVASGGTVHVAAGSYDEALNIDSFSGLNIVGEKRTSTILKSSTTQSWAISGYPQYNTRQVVIRVVNSTNITISGITIDLDLIKGNNRFGILYWDSTGTIHNDILKNMSADDLAGGYNEITAYLRAPGFTDAARAHIAVTSNTFINPGRLGVVTHDFVHAVIEGNTFIKAIDDFGYAIELGSRSTGVIKSNTISGYDTPAASDGSLSAGIYIENSFTGGLPHVVKSVLIEGNEVYDSQWGIYIGNEFDGYAGDVDLNVTLTENSLHDNLEGAVYIVDEDRQYGSSVTVASSGNTLANNGGAGYYINTYGDGELHVSLAYDIITDHDIGILVQNNGPDSSVYDVSIANSDIFENLSFGIKNEVATLMVTAENNWWGAASGPHDASGSVEVPPCTTAPAVELNADGTGNEVSGNADYCPWLSESYNIFDTDIDGVADYIDNCFDMPNGEDLGMCVKVIGGVFVSTGEACGGPGDCQFDKGEICQMAQQDTNDNGIGDACECYADISGPAGARDSRVDAFDLLKMKQEFNRTDCMPETCQADLNGDGKVDSFDLLIMKVQFNKTGCPVP